MYLLTEKELRDLFVDVIRVTQALSSRSVDNVLQVLNVDRRIESYRIIRQGDMPQEDYS